MRGGGMRRASYGGLNRKRRHRYTQDRNRKQFHPGLSEGDDDDDDEGQPPR